MTDLPALLQDFYRDKLTMTLRHVVAARVIGQYDANNTYQYIINREETQLAWVAAAIAGLGGTVFEASAPERTLSGKGADAAHAAMAEDVRDARAFVDRWRPRVDAVANAQQAKMLRVILGETIEQHRFFEQALAGRTDLLGRRGPEVGALVGSVLPTRWIE